MFQGEKLVGASLQPPNPEHAILQVVEQINHFFFKKNEFIFSVDLPKAFDTIDHQILLKNIILRYC